MVTRLRGISLTPEQGEQTFSPPTLLSRPWQ